MYYQPTEEERWQLADAGVERMAVLLLPKRSRSPYDPQPHETHYVWDYIAYFLRGNQEIAQGLSPDLTPGENGRLVWNHPPRSWDPRMIDGPHSNYRVVEFLRPSGSPKP